MPSFTDQCPDSGPYRDAHEIWNETDRRESDDQEIESDVFGDDRVKTI